MKQFKELPIKKDVVIIASGLSRNEVPVEDYEKLKNKFFVIAINFVNNIIPDARIWSDVKVTDYLQDTEKDCLWITRLQAIHPATSKDMSSKIDYWFNEKKEEFPVSYYTSNGENHSCKWTLYWLLQLLRKYFPDKKIYIFGMDCTDNMSYVYEKGDVVHRENHNNNCEGIPECFAQRKAKEPLFFKDVYNCNFFSAVGCIDYIDYKEIL